MIPVPVNAQVLREKGGRFVMTGFSGKPHGQSLGEVGYPEAQTQEGSGDGKDQRPARQPHESTATPLISGGRGW
jgi:hypothetical protein